MAGWTLESGDMAVNYIFVTWIFFIGI